jgi:DNA-binding NtrC family response regulator
MVVIDRDARSYKVIKQLLGTDHRVDFTESPLLALDYVREKAPDVVFLNIDHGDAMDLLADMSLHTGHSPVVAMMDSVELRRVVDAVHRGACDVVAQPIQVRDLQLAVTRALARRQLCAPVMGQFPVPEIVGMSGPMIRLRRDIQRVAAGTGPVVITGESGVGKELVARALHRLSPVAAGPFEARNCGALPDPLVEAELFGTERGAYTDAVRRPGAFELASGGTLFLDEIGDLSLPAQVKLLRVLETGDYYRVGGTSVRTTSARFIAATNQDLRKRMERGEFRGDLFYRINVFRISIPPLREHPADIPGLVQFFYQLLVRSGVTTRAQGFAADALERLSAYGWPGNVRELRNVVWRALVDTNGPAIRASELTFD